MDLSATYQIRVYAQFPRQQRAIRLPVRVGLMAPEDPSQEEGPQFDRRSHNIDRGQIPPTQPSDPLATPPGVQRDSKPRSTKKLAASARAA